ncbi:MAG: hypothetical protein JST40_14115 [Armatimonadetes bacterium]|nr:hypothetical protein [Armatimonadota bacterium]
MKSQRIILTGFGPFGNIEDNPSSHLARALGAEYHTRLEILEVSFEAVDRFLEEVGEDFDALMSLGVAANRNSVCLERRARNEIGTQLDVLGRTRESKIAPTGRDLSATLWGRGDAKHRLVRYSKDAGTYLCNYLLYESLRRFPEKKVGFVHVVPFETIGQADQLTAIRPILDRLVR